MSDELRIVEIKAVDPPQDVRVDAKTPRTIIRLKAPLKPPPPSPRDDPR